MTGCRPSMSASPGIDGLSLTFALLISGIGALIVLYSGGYLKGHPHQGRFFSFILMFMGAMLGLVVSDSFLMLFVFWELTSITSFLLIGFDHSREAARRAALQALVVTGLGGLSLLAGLLVLWKISGIASCRGLLASGAIVGDKPVLSGGAAARARRRLHQIGAVSVPFLAAERHGSADAGLGLPAFGDHGEGRRLSVDAAQPGARRTPAWEMLLPVFGGATLVVGALLAVRQTDLKLMLAYTTVASLGLLVLLTGFGSRGDRGGGALSGGACPLQGRAVHGRRPHRSRDRNARRHAARRLRRAMPLTFAAGLLPRSPWAACRRSSASSPRKRSTRRLPSANWPTLLALVAIAGNALMFAVAFWSALKPFIGATATRRTRRTKARSLLWLGPLVLAVLGLGAACSLRRFTRSCRARWPPRLPASRST